MESDPSLATRHDGFLSGQLLIAMPGIGDDRFERAVVLICAHDEDHAMGLALNRPVEGLTLPEILDRLEIPDAASSAPDLVVMGGPVQRERGFVLHTDDYEAADASVVVTPGVALTATRDVLVAMASHIHAPRRALMALGYAGWGAGQLESEIRNNVWLTCEPDEDLIFGADHEGKWSRALAKLGIDPQFLSAQAGRA